MKKAILAKKVGMTQVFSEEGILIPVTVLEAGPCFVTQIKTVENDGYSALQVGFVDLKEDKKPAEAGKSKKYRSKIIKPVRGHFAKSGVAPKKYVREFKLEDVSSYELGSEIRASVFEAGDKIDVTGLSKGKGTQGAIKRHGFSRGPETHGSKYHRGGGALAGSSSPGKVRKGTEMSGQMGHERVTVQNLEVVKVDEEKNLILVKGSVPGPKGCLIMIKDSVKA